MQQTADAQPTGPTQPEAPSVLVDERPWGRFEQLALNEQVTVKIITVEPGHRLSLQTHTSRDESWKVLDEGLTVEIGGVAWAPQVGEQVWIPRGVTHRVGCTGSSAARFVEVAYGEFDECDIVRLEDDYARPETPDRA
ncbi:mannose-1-phosphate guanylyltransferase/mannose-6-phosphate isomerase [Motilibacter peucedani]|uniref:Mannose-1-phosphate guanylyltransferase/mannose-6-phosphate isomerase n=1 Tax=Motilibacter peucedani TaxID=598650 RepID=A0A420XM05_9ACTN|nr:phosphomannose isomerase type II C-terminal cupin domain [Motilibacter peucedani]RKS71338.1 mannose-1-phosphate guanylyltransferase/mannose-6-phosphate isomerase [Motilibacter peucedani]